MTASPGPATRHNGAQSASSPANPFRGPAAAPFSILPEALLDRCAERAPTYDRENRFFQEDLDELRAAGYLKAAVPPDLGGAGLGPREVFHEQRRLAYHAPATALAVNMHLFWTGVAADLRRAGDPSLEWILRDAAAGEVFAAGHSEAGNEVSVVFSKTEARRVDGGYRFTGHKIFTTLTPAWTRLGVYGLEAKGPGGPHIVHGFIRRDTEGYRIKRSWDVLGMRATQSEETLLEGAFAPDAAVARRVPMGTTDPFVLSLFFWGPGSFGNLYCAIAERARDLTVAAVAKRQTNLLRRSMAYHPEIQRRVAEMTFAIESMRAQVDALVGDWTRGADYGPYWLAKVAAAKHNCIEGSRHVVDLALEASGGSGLFRGHELERLYRDVRCGSFHPPNGLLAHEMVGKMTLGIGLDEQPRWG